MKITRALIEKFLQNQCTAEEAAAVENHLAQHPEELEALLPEQEWDAFEPENRLHPTYSAQMLEQVRRETKVQGIRRYSAWAAAAAVVLLLGAGGIWWQSKKQAALQQDLLIANNGKVLIPGRDTLVQNTSDTTQRISLSDGSEVVLEGQSSLQWQPGFTPAQRVLYLKGAATFTVTKEEGRPFTVYSENVATTVLGTAFRISAYEGDVKVRLLTGKVMVKTTGAQADKEMVYLTPGQECAFNKGQRSLTVYDYESGPESVSPVPLKGNITENGEELLFTNVPLPAVLNRFKTVYNVEISFSAQQLRTYYFTGQISKKDSLAGILSTIAELNRLKVTQDSAGYHVHK